MIRNIYKSKNQVYKYKHFSLFNHKKFKEDDFYSQNYNMMIKKKSILDFNKKYKKKPISNLNYFKEDGFII